MPALGGCRPPGGVCPGPGRLQAARRGLCRPREGAGHQKGCVPPLGGYRRPGRFSAGPGRIQAARKGVYRPREGTGGQEGSVLTLES